ncbi:MAG: hypothetical protein CVT60_01645 [Actinobacteria bacterium HGW-Actinobacteria-10]|jgi:hypothetical protein|nr:MAG: hypothetical protein CVT60_01645 [Actinobacteria bacterium HGW-Actinobacteria-10]
MGFVSSEKSADETTQPTETLPDAQGDSSECRAIDAATHRYAAAEQEHRRERFELAVTRAQAH